MNKIELVAYAWLTPRGNLVPLSGREEAHRLRGRGPVALVKITFKSAADLAAVNSARIPNHA